METFPLPSGDIAHQEHDRENPPCKQDQWKGTVANRHGRQRLSVLVENGEVQNEQTDYGGHFFSVIVV